MLNTNDFPKFLSNLPNGIDLYATASQEKTAKSISDHIKKSSKEYRLIGLDGEWGSGKSNAISIIEKQLGNDFHLFIYDTWAHQEDLQRRSFLEELTENLQEKLIVNQQKWKSELNNLLAKKKVTITKTIPRLSWAIITSLAVTLFTPITKAISDSLPACTSSFWKVLITAAPLLFALIIWLIFSFRNKENWNLTELFRIYEKEDREKIVDETISENEPSLREFRSWIDKLDTACSKKIIIVFDNMDRLPPEKIKIIWTLLHTFFSSKFYTNIWIIVPFDRKHIRDAFGKEEDDKDYEKTNHFINKTFSVIFNISPVLLTDWKNVFEFKYNEAFGDSEKEEYNITRRIFDLYTVSITPRKIISFINEMVSMKLVWDGQIKLRYIAIFVLNRQKILENPVAQILNKEFLNKSFNLFAGDETVSDNIAALLYNVPLEKAVQVSMQREIELAIRERRINDLKEFSKNTDFVSILEQIPTEDSDVESAVFCLNEIEFSLNESEKDSLQIIWDRLVSQYLIIDLILLEFSNTMKILLKKCRIKDQKKLLSYILNQFNKINQSSKQYFLVLGEVEKFILENKMEINCLEFINEKVLSPEGFVEYLEIAKDNYKRYKVKCDNVLLENYFISKLPEDLGNVSILKYLKPEYKFDLLKTKIEQNIKEGKITNKNITSIFYAYKLISNNRLLDVKLSDSEISSLLNNTEKDSNDFFELSAMRIARGADIPYLGVLDDSILKRTDDIFISEITRRIESYNFYGSLLLAVVTWPKPILIHVLKSISESSEFGITMNVEKVLPKYDEIISLLEVSDETMLNKLNGWEKHLHEKLSTSNLQEIIPQPSFYFKALSIENILTKFIFEIAIKHIKEVTVDSWRNAFADQTSYIFKLLLLLLESNKISELPDNVFIAYKEALKSISNNGPSSYDISTEGQIAWIMLFNKSDHIHLQSTIKDIRDLFLRNLNITREKFIFFEPLLRNLGELSKESGDVVRHILIPISGFTDCFIEILTNTEFYANIIGLAGNDAFEFIDLVREKIETESNELLNQFGSLINSGLATKTKITFAKYYSPLKDESEAMIITDALKRIIENEKQLHFKVDNCIVNGADPDFGNIKKLKVNYSYEGVQKEKTFDEGSWLRLP